VARPPLTGWPGRASDKRPRHAGAGHATPEEGIRAEPFFSQGSSLKPHSITTRLPSGGKKNRKTPRETEISRKTAPPGGGFYKNSAETLFKNRNSIKTTRALLNPVSHPPQTSAVIYFTLSIFFKSSSSFSAPGTLRKLKKLEESSIFLKILRFSKEPDRATTMWSILHH
jgi:hypothetical protein